MKNLTTLFLLFTLTTLSGQTISSADTIQANDYFQRGDNLLKAREFDSSRFYLNKAAEIFEAASVPQQQLECLTKISEGYRRESNLTDAIALSDQSMKIIERLGEENEASANAYYNRGIILLIQRHMEEAQVLFSKCLEIRLSIFEEAHLSVAAAYNILGVLSNQLGDLDQALEYYLKAFEVSEQQNEIDPGLGNYLDNIGIIYDRKSLYTKSLPYKEKALEVRLNQTGEMDLSVANSYNNIGAYYYNIGNYELSVENLEKALEIRRTLSNRPNASIASSYLNLGIIHHALGSYIISAEFFNKTIAIYKEMSDETNPTVGAAITGLGNSYYGQEKYELALDFQRQGLEFARKHGRNRVSEAISLNNIGNSLFEKGDVDQAIKHFEESLSLKKTFYNGESNPDVADNYRSLAEAYAKKEPKKGIEYNEQALSIFDAIYNGPHPRIAKTYLSMARIYMNDKQYTLGLKAVQKSIVANLVNFDDTSHLTNPKLKEYLDQQTFLSSLLIKSDIYSRLFESAGDVTNLERSLLNYQFADILVGKIRKTHLRRNDKLKLRKLASQVYESSIAAAYELYLLTDEPKYKALVFEFMEKSRAVLLKENLLNNSAKHFAGIPDSTLLLEQNLRIEESFYKSRILNMQASKSDTTEEFGLFEQVLFEINAKRDSLAKAFETYYAGYYELKYDDRVINLKSTQLGLSANEVLIEYFDSDSLLVVFSVTKDSSWVNTIDRDSLLLTQIDEYIQLFNEPSNLVLAPEESRFAPLSNELYRKILKSTIEKLPVGISKLIVAPSGKLSYIPWGNFVRTLTDGDNSYGDLDYLFKTFAISNVFSATTRFGIINENGTSANNLLGMAPEYKGEITSSPIANVLRDRITPLQWTSSEIKAATGYFKGDLVDGNRATEEYFKEKANKSQLLHLAMHALVDNENPMRSGLIFSSDSTSEEDGILYIHELLNMNLSAKMVVLSACQTGIGKLEQGEGVMSLGKAFAYAGVPSVIMSHWQVDDQSTSTLMGYFYEFLAEGLSKSEALRQAKLKYLVNASPEKSHPFFWGSFVVIGDDSSVFTKNYSYYYLVIGLLLIISVVVYRKRKQRRIKMSDSGLRPAPVYLAQPNPT